MRGSIKLFTWFGIPVHIHWSFGLIFLYAIWIGYENNLDIVGTLWLMGFFIALFACVLLHEYGHALTARRYQVQTRDIILTPIGGIARLERMPEKPLQEFLVAIAGPMVNVVIAILLLGLSRLIFHGEQWMFFTWFFEEQFSFTPDEAKTAEVMANSNMQIGGLLFYIPALLLTNIALVVFNLIPAFPMDGGRIFRALLAMRIGRLRATRVASMLGQIIAVVFVLWGIWSGAFTMALIGIFVFTTARSENSMVQLDDMLRRYKAGDLLRRNFTKVYANDWMQTPISLLRTGLERHFLVFDMAENLVGALEEDNIVKALQQRNLSTSVESCMENVHSIDIEDNLFNVYAQFQQLGVSILAVYEQGELVGVIDAEGFQHFMRMPKV